MSSGFKVYKKREWWRESGEVPDYARKMDEAVKPASKKEEEYELKRGSDGRNKPSITKAYAGEKGQSRAKKVVSEKSKHLVAKKMKEADYEDDELEDYSVNDLDDTDVDSDINDVSDDPMEADPMDDVPAGGNICTCPACGAKLVIETSDEEGDEDLEGEVGDEFEANDDMDVESDEDDITQPKLESKIDKYQKKVEGKKKSIIDEEAEFEKAYQEWKKERAKKLEAKKGRKVEAESEIGVEYGSDTSDMAKKGQTNSGTKTDVGAGNDDDPDITSSETGDMVKKGQTASGVKTVQSEKKKVAKKPIAEEEQAATTDPFEDGDDLEGMLDGDDFADIPVDVGADPDAITKYKGVQERRAARKAGTSGMKESFDFKKLVRGDYTK